MMMGIMGSDRWKMRAASRRLARRVLLFEGDGISSEIIDAARKVVDVAVHRHATDETIAWIEMDGYGNEDGKSGIMEDHLAAFDDVRVLLKGSVSIGQGHVDVRGRRFSSPNQALRKVFDLEANIRPATSMRFPWARRFDDAAIDLVVVRQNTEDLYATDIVPEEVLDAGDTVHATKRITRGASARIARIAFEFADKRRPRAAGARVTAVHKANVMKLSDGLFLDECRKTAAAREHIQYEEALVDSCCAEMVLGPENFDVLVAPNAWGDIISDLAGGIVGSLGLLGSANIGARHALFEPAHGSAPSLAGKGIANPASTILSAAMMLDHFEAPDLHDAGDAIRQALRETFESGCATPDLGGRASTEDVVNEIVNKL